MIESFSTHLLKPIESWMQDETVSEIVLNEPKHIFVERHGQFEHYSVPAFSAKRLDQLFRLIANENHQVINKEKPLLSGALSDGSRIQLVLPPIANTHAFSIRIKKCNRLSLDDLQKADYFKQCKAGDIDSGNDDKALSEYYHNAQWIDFIKLALKSRKNIVISGATSSGKTTFLNACLNELSLEERLIILEDTPEIQLRHKNALRLLAYKGQQSLSGITMQDLLQCSLRLRPDRIIVGEVRGKSYWQEFRTNLNCLRI